MDWPKTLRDAIAAVPAGFAGNLAFFLAGFLGRWLADRSVRRLSARSLFGFRTGDVQIVIGSPYGIDPATRELHRSQGVPLFGYGPLCAYESLMGLLNTAYPRDGHFSVTTSKTFSRQNLGCNLILIGFPLGNEITALLMKDLALPLEFLGHQLVDAQTGAVRYQAKVQDGRIVEDVGCILRVPNPYAQDTTVIVFAGCESFGVKAAADFFQPRNRYLLHGTTRFREALYVLSHFHPAARYYQAIVSTHVRALFTSSPILEERLDLGLSRGRPTHRTSR